MVAGGERGDARPDLDHLTGALVPADDRELLNAELGGDRGVERHVAGDEVLVGVAQAGADQLEEDLTGLRRIEVDLLDDPVLWAHGGRAKGHEVRVGRSPVVHRDEVEACDAERDRVRGHFFEVAAQRLFPFVDAEDRLKARRGRFRLRHAVVQGEGVERLGVQTALVGQVENPPPLDRWESFNFFHQGGPVPLA